jgi:transcriptional regulator with XRE-family HTH domain
MDEAAVETDVPSVGERLRAAREAKGMSLEDIAAQTRIPQRHLESLEQSRWDQLPAPTYTMGFARSYASSVGLDRTEISDQLRTELGGSRPSTAQPEVFEPADPARTMPRTLVFGAIGAVLLLVALMSWLNKRSLDQPEDVNNVAAAEAPAAAPQATPQAPPAGPQQVTVTATQPVWLEIREKGGPILYSAMMVPGQGFTVPPTATAPVLKTGKPEALRINVGNSVAPPVGPAATTVSNVSLLPADLMRGGQAPAATVAPAPAPPRAATPQPPRSTTRTKAHRRPRTTAPAEQAPTPQPPPTNTTG